MTSTFRMLDGRFATPGHFLPAPNHGTISGYYCFTALSIGKCQSLLEYHGVCFWVSHG